MIGKIKESLVSILPSDSNKLKNWLFVGCCLLFALYSFSIPAFSNRYPFNYISIAISLLMCVSMAVYVFLYGRFKINIFIALLVLFNITILITHIINSNLQDLPKTVFLMSVVAFFAYQFMSEYKKPNLFIVLVLVSGIVFSAYYILHYRSEILDFSNMFENRLGAYFDNQNEIGKEFGIFAIISLSFLLTSKKVYIKILSAFSFVVFVFLILTTGSISNLLTIFFVGALIIILAQKTWFGKLIAFLIVVSLVSTLILSIQLPFMEYFKTRFERIIYAFFDKEGHRIDGSAINRLEGFLTAIKVGLNKPLFGFGYMRAKEFTFRNIQAHNNIAELFLDFGVFGLVIFELMLLLPLIYSFSGKNKIQLLSILFHMVVFQLFLTTYYKKFEYLFLAFAFASLEESFKTKFIIWDSSRLRAKGNRKVLFEIIPSLSPIGGAERFAADFAEVINKDYSKDYDVKFIVLYKQKDSFLLKELESKGLEIYQLDKRNGIDLRCSFALRELIMKHNPEIIHTHLLSLATLKMALPIRRRKMKIVHTIHHDYSPERKSQKLLKHLTKTKYLTPICVAKEPASNYSKYFKQNVNYINNGIVLDRYSSSKPITARTHDCLIVGRFVEVKNQKFILDLIKHSKYLQSKDFVFLGDGPLLGECEKLARESKLKNVSFKGAVSNVNRYMSNSKILIVPSFSEGNPIVINEAFASGMMVVANNVGGMKNLLSNLNYDSLCSIEDPRAFAKLLEKNLKRIDSNKFEKFDYDLSKISMDTTINKYIKVFNQ